ncbi:hypothetical protein HYR99_15730 [Candidatus Poribacteria bacterium]|nr:hypothetical protein [Candidatus Poribacteria bacterium]
MLNQELLDKYVRLSNNQIGKVIRIRSQVRGRIAEIELIAPQSAGNYVLAAIDAPPSEEPQKFKNLPTIVEVLGAPFISPNSCAEV